MDWNYINSQRVQQVQVVLVRWLKFTWDSGFAIKAILALVVCAVGAFVIYGYVPVVPLLVAATPLIAVAIHRYVKSTRTSTAPTMRETLRRARPGTVRANSIEKDRPLVGVVLGQNGRVAAYVAIMQDSKSSATALIVVSPRWPRRTRSIMSGITISEALAKAREDGVQFLPQSNYSDALWEMAFAR